MYCKVVIYTCKIVYKHINWQCSESFKLSIVVILINIYTATVCSYGLIMVGIYKHYILLLVIYTITISGHNDNIRISDLVHIRPEWGKDPAKQDTCQKISNLYSLLVLPFVRKSARDREPKTNK